MRTNVNRQLRRKTPRQFLFSQATRPRLAATVRRNSDGFSMAIPPKKVAKQTVAVGFATCSPKSLSNRISDQIRFWVKASEWLNQHNKTANESQCLKRQKNDSLPGKRQTVVCDSTLGTQLQTIVSGWFGIDNITPLWQVFARIRRMLVFFS